VYNNTAPGIKNLKVKLEKEIEMLNRNSGFPEDELFMDKKSLPNARKSYFDVNHYHSLLTQIQNERQILEQGCVFEELVAYLLNNIGFKVTAKESASNAHNPDMRIDMVVWNESGIPKFQIFGNPIVIECKLMDIDTVHIQQYITYLTSTGLTTGFLFSVRQFSADAISQAIKAISRRIYIILFDMTELKEILSEQDFINKIEDKIRETARFFLRD
jgi:hypothetical protein